MKKILVLFGGAGYIGRNIISEFLKKEVFDYYIVGDIQELKGYNEYSNVEFRRIDVRNKIKLELHDINLKSSWIFNLAAVHREPGHEFKEYFDTNIPGAKNVTSFAREAGINNIFFTSSIAPYGKSRLKRTEESQIYPETAYGISKALAEGIHEEWLNENLDRRLIIVRPSVIFGPHDPGNVYRMILALKKGTFILPDGGNVIKAYGYIFGLIDSIIFTLNRTERFILYNYAENPLVPLNEMTRIVKEKFNYRKPVAKVPVNFLAFVASFISRFFKLFGKPTDIHPVRVKKAGFPTNIEPTYLINNGFNFKYDFEEALNDWLSRAPEEF